MKAGLPALCKMKRKQKWWCVFVGGLVMRKSATRLFPELNSFCTEREENPVRASFACRNETAASLRHPPTQPVIGIPSYRCADESHSPEMGFPRRLPCPLYCLWASSVRSLQRYENKPRLINSGTGRREQSSVLASSEQERKRRLKARERQRERK